MMNLNCDKMNKIITFTDGSIQCIIIPLKWYVRAQLLKKPQYYQKALGKIKFKIACCDAHFDA